MSPSGKQPTLKAIEHGDLVHTNGNKFPFEVVHGWHAKASLECDALWAQGWVALFDMIVKAESDPVKQLEILKTISTEDIHWRWIDKAVHYSTNEYEWFHLHADGKPQAACVIYHPKPSALGSGNIFYVEFVAVAPWNRPCKIRAREFNGLGTILLRAALRFAVKVLTLRPGFCLHSLPKAEAFYTKLDMVNVAGKEKDGLLYFELPQTYATKLMKVS